MSAPFLPELGEGFSVILGGFFAEPVEMGFPVGDSLRSWRRPCDIPDCSAIAAQFETLSALDCIQNAGGFAIQFAHSQQFHVRHHKPDTGFVQGSVFDNRGSTTAERANIEGAGARFVPLINS